MDINFSSGTGGFSGNQDHATRIEKVVRGGFFQRLGKAMMGVVIGFLLFFSAFPLLRWGENRQNLAEFVAQAKTVSADSMPSDTGLVKVSGLITSTESVNDPDFLNPLSGKKILQLERTVQMYAWVEKKTSETQGDHNITRYDYSMEWTSVPPNSSSFDTQQGHFNPPLTLQGQSYQVGTALVGKLSFSAGKAEFYATSPLQVDDARLSRTTGKPLSTDGRHVYLSYGVAVPAPPGRNPGNNPQVGDVRVSYDAFADAQNGTVVGDWNGTIIAPHAYDKTSQFLGVYPGTAEVFAAHLEFLHKAGTWGIRIGTFFMMWIGLGLMVGPITTVVESIPLIGGAGKSVIGLFTGALAFVFWCVALILSHLLAVLLLLVLVVGGVGFFVVKRRKPAVA